MRRALYVVLLCAGVLAAFGAASRVQVTITDRKFSPPALTVPPGQTVTWANRDNLDHTIDADDGSFSSGKLKTGRSFTHRFDKAGTYPYSCTLHPREKGRIIVKK